MSFTSQHDLAINPDFINRITQAMAKSAIAVQAEAPATANHTNRSTFAQEALSEPERTAAVMAVGVATNPTIEAAGLAATDSDIEFTINSMWDAYAGVL